MPTAASCCLRESWVSAPNFASTACAVIFESSPPVALPTALTQPYQATNGSSSVLSPRFSQKGAAEFWARLRLAGFVFQKDKPSGGDRRPLSCQATCCCSDTQATWSKPCMLRRKAFCGWKKRIREGPLAWRILGRVALALRKSSWSSSVACSCFLPRQRPRGE